jgi:plasmid stabilization system protein ParE
MYKVEISPIAQEDLLRTKQYIEEAFGAKKANDIITTIVASLSKFQEFPLLGRPLSNLIDVPTDYMYFVIEKNYVFYRLEENVVKIIRILSTRQDFMSILFKD